MNAVIPTGHSKLGASSAYRWLACPKSVSYIEENGLKSGSSEYAKEGTAAHAVGEACLLDANLSPHDFIGRAVEGWEVTEDMADAVQVYVDYVRSIHREGFEDYETPPRELMVEARFHLKHLDEHLFGTNDACVLDFDAKTLHVIDYKHGAGIAVDPEENSQLLYYALGALELGDFDKVFLTIVQPRAHEKGVLSWEQTADQVRVWGQEVLLKGVAETRKKGLKFVPGDHCRFCPAAQASEKQSHICPGLTDFAEKQLKAVYSAVPADIKKKPEPKMPVIDTMTDEHLGKVLYNTPVIEQWLKAVKAAAHARAMEGAFIPSQKLVRATTRRKWVDEKAAKETLIERGYEEKDILAEPKLVSFGQLEKKLGKDALKDLLEKPEGALVLEPVSSKKEAVHPIEEIKRIYSTVATDDFLD